MMFFGGMKIFTVHIKSGVAGAGEKPVFVREGFNFFAFLFTGFWALYHRLWLQLVLILAFNMMILFLLRSQTFDAASIAVLQISFRLLVGWQANDWIRAKLARRSYIMADVAAADSRLRAEQRYFERHLASA